ncbi:hypothetical protein BGZ51_008210 [Haplosporangium sp. Z 767]|nr:hypothetical protein BGZ50_004840 [Haplosporangium sp. Z 11]KAF9190808.1 hypothetical protein BGZ51_008210 [Haplosporangium sp. Z 767]
MRRGSTPPIERIRSSVETITKLPRVMSPTIPTWTEPARPVTGGKQPGKVPEVPPDLCVSSSDESEDEAMDSDQPESAAESEGMEMSEVDANPEYRSIGRKTAQHRNLMTGSIGSKRPKWSASKKPAHPAIEMSNGRCWLLTSRQAKELPRRCGKAVLSKSPVIVRIVLQSPLSRTDITTLATGDSHCSPLASDPESPVIKVSRSTAKGRVKNVSSDEEEESQHKRQRAVNNTSSEVVESQDTKLPSSPSQDQGQSTTKRSKSRKKDGRGVKGDVSSESISRDTNAMDVDIDRALKRPSVRSPSPESLVSKRRDTDGGRSRDSTDGDRDGYRKKQKQLKPDETRRDGRDRPRNRSRSRSRSPRGKYDRNDERDTKTSRERRDYDNDRGSLKKIRQRESSRERRERSSHRRRDKSWSRERSRSRERERSRESKWARSRSRSKERASGRRDNERRKRESSTTSRADAKDSGRQPLDSKQLSGHKKSESQSGSMSDAVRRFSQSIASAGSTSPNYPSTEARGQRESLPKASSTGSLDTKTLPSDPTKRRVVEENQRRRSGSEVDTPKAETDLSAPLSSSLLSARRTSYQSNGQNRRLSTLPSDLVTRYSREFSRYQTQAVSLKRKADEINKTHSNRRLGAIVYFLSNNAFLRAFLLNDKHFAVLYPQNPDLAQKEAMACWESMKQFSSALSNQCRGQFQGLDGVSSLLEALVFYKCHNYSNYRLHKEMQSLEQFKKPRPGNTSSQDAVMIDMELAIRLLQYTEDWAVVTRCLEECKTKLTADIAREQFPETFKKWCIHPEDMGQALTRGFDMEVKKREKVVVGVSDGGTHVEKERVKAFPRIQWPLGTHLHLGDLLDFADEALHEYQTRNGLEYQGTTLS